MNLGQRSQERRVVRSLFGKLQQPGTHWDENRDRSVVATSYTSQMELTSQDIIERFVENTSQEVQ